MIALSPPAFSIATSIRSGSGLVESTSSALVYPSFSSAASSKVDVVLDLVLLRRAGQDDLQTFVLQSPIRSWAPSNAATSGISSAVGSPSASRISSPCSSSACFAEEGLDDLVATHPDQPVDPPGGDIESAGLECPLPGDRVLVVRVDERAVDVEDHSFWLDVIIGGDGYLDGLRRAGRRVRLRRSPRSSSSRTRRDRRGYGWSRSPGRRPLLRRPSCRRRSRCRS